MARRPIVSWTFSGDTDEALTTDEAKKHLNVTHSNDDTYIDKLVLAARRVTERSTGLALVDQTVTMYLDRFPETIWLPRPPVVSVTSVKYYDTSDTQQTLSTDDYQKELKSWPARLVPVHGTTWPQTYNRLAAVEVIYVTGYTNGSGTIPEDLKHAVRLLLGHYYENREPVTVDGVPRKVQKTFDALVAQFKVRLPRMF